MEGQQHPPPPPPPLPMHSLAMQGRAEEAEDHTSAMSLADASVQEFDSWIAVLRARADTVRACLRRGLEDEDEDEDGEGQGEGEGAEETSVVSCATETLLSLEAQLQHLLALREATASQQQTLHHQKRGVIMGSGVGARGGKGGETRAQVAGSGI